MDNIQLAELAERAKGGDMSAFETIYIETSPDIYSIAYEITKDKEQAGDLMQDCFVAAIENISGLKDTQKIRNWLIRIVANKSRDYLKKKKPVVMNDENMFIFENIEETDSSFVPEESLEEKERSKEVNSILQSIGTDKRLCILLQYKYNMSCSEIAEELGISEGAVKSRIFRAKADIEKEARKRERNGLPLFGLAPFNLAVSELLKSSDKAAASFSGSAAQSSAFSGVASAASVGTGTATAAAASATGVGAKIAAASVAQKVAAGIAAASIVTGSAVGTTAMVKNKMASERTTTAVYTEEYTTAPAFYFEETTVPESTTVQETITVPFSVSTTRNNPISTYADKQTVKASESKSESKPNAVIKTTKKHNQTKPSTTRRDYSLNSTKATTLTTIKAAQTSKSETTTQKQSTTTQAPTEEATDPPKTTEATTKLPDPTLIMNIYEMSGEKTDVLTITVPPGTVLTHDYLVNCAISAGYLPESGINCESIDQTAQSGESYTLDVYL